MKVLLVTDFYPPVVFGGYEMRCADVARGLAARGHEIAVATSFHGDDAPSSRGNVHRILRSYWDLWHKPKTTEEFLRSVRDDGKRLRELVGKFAPDVISVWNMLGLSYSHAVTLQRQDAPCVFHIDDDWMLREDECWDMYGNPGPERIRDVLGREGARLASTVPPRDNGGACLFISRFRMHQHHAAGVPVKGSRVVHGGIDVELFSGRRFQTYAADGTVRILFSGALTEAKGWSLPLRALALMNDGERVRISLSYAGGGLPEAEAAFDALVLELGLEGRARRLGKKTRREMPDVYGANDVLVFPSTGSEGFPLSILEAMSCGLLAVSSARGGQAEYLAHQGNALIFEPEDPGSLRDCFSFALNEPARAASLAKKGRDLVRSSFSLERMVLETEAFLLEHSRKIRTSLDGR